MHPWHDIELGDRVPEVVTAVIEIPCGSQAKYAIDKKTGFLRLKQMLVTTAHYPVHYGFIPRTLGTDRDALDVMVMCQASLPPLTIMTVRPIGGIRLEYSSKGFEEKLIAVEQKDPEYEGITSLKELPTYRMEELEQFFKVYKQIEGKKVEVKKLFGLSHARKLLVESIDRYRDDPIAA